LKVAKATKDPYKMGRKLLPEVFTPKELEECSCVPGSRGKPQANMTKLSALLGLQYTWLCVQ